MKIKKSFRTYETGVLFTAIRTSGLQNPLLHQLCSSSSMGAFCFSLHKHHKVNAKIYSSNVENISEDETPVRKRGRPKRIIHVEQIDLADSMEGIDSETMKDTDDGLEKVNVDNFFQQNQKSEIESTNDSDPKSGFGDETSKPLTMSQQLEDMIDDFLNGEFNGFTSSSPEPSYGMTPEEVVITVLDALKHENTPTEFHGSAVTQMFCTPLARHERLRQSQNSWRELLRRSPTAKFFSSQLRQSQFFMLTHWDTMEIMKRTSKSESLVKETLNVKLCFEEGVKRIVNLVITLRNPNGAWLIDSIDIVQDSLRSRQRRPG